jgi:hypothetical protein
MPTAIAHMSDDEVHAIVGALQDQVTKDFRDAHGIDARLSFVRKDKLTGWEGKWNLVFLDSADVANALGYHDLTPDGLPVGKVFVDTTKLYGGLVSVTASHELLEMLLDPMINLVAEDTKRRYFVAYEACDAVEDDRLSYLHRGIHVSDFVLPDFFNPLGAGSGRSMSFLGNVTEPFQLAKGGYEAVYIPGRGWQQIVARDNGPDPQDIATIGSRRERRFRGSKHGQTRTFRRSID